jgi:translation elongation factor P/translation initiation factor 5A
MATTSDIRETDYVSEYNNDIFKIIRILHVEIIKRSTFVKNKIKPTNGKVIDKILFLREEKLMT